MKKKKKIPKNWAFCPKPGRGVRAAAGAGGEEGAGSGLGAEALPEKEGGKWLKRSVLPHFGAWGGKGEQQQQSRVETAPEVPEDLAPGAPSSVCGFFFNFAYFCLFSSRLSALKSDEFDSPRPLQLSKKAPKSHFFPGKKATSARPGPDARPPLGETRGFASFFARF